MVEKEKIRTSIKKEKEQNMKKIVTIVLLIIVMFSYAQMDNYHILTKEMLKPFQIEQINIDTTKHYLLTQEMLKPFQSIKEYQSVLLMKKNKNQEIKLYLSKPKSINYYFINGFYYNPIIYRF